MSSSPTRQSTAAFLAAALIPCLLALAVGSFRTGFTGKDELRYAQIAREMDSLPDLFHLHYEGEVYPDKPPMYFWMARAGYVLTGVSAFGARLPLILCTLFTALLTFDIGRRFFGLRVALLGTLFYGVSIRVLWSGHLVKLDPPLVAFTTLALWCVAICLDDIDEKRRPSFWSVIGFWAAMGLGFLVKGPLGFVIPLGVLGAYRVARLRFLAAVGVSTLVGIVVGLGVIGLWVLPGLHFGGWDGYFRVIYEQEIVGRTTEPWRHTKEGLLNIFYYFLRIWPMYLPGSVFLPVTALLLWRRRKGAKNREWRGLVYLMCWLGFVFVFFTLMKSKRGQYILPLYPALGLLTGWAVDRALAILRGEASLADGATLGRRWLTVPMGIVAVVGVGAGLVVLFGGSALAGKFNATPFLGTRLLILAVMAACAVGIARGMRRGRLSLALGWTVAVPPLLVVLAFFFFFPRGYQDGPRRDLARWLNERVPPGGVVWTRDKEDPGLSIFGHYYVRRIKAVDMARYLPEGFEITNPKIARFLMLEAATEPLIAIVTGEDIDEYREAGSEMRLHVLRRFDLVEYRDKGGIVVISNVEDGASLVADPSSGRIIGNHPDA